MITNRCEHVDENSRMQCGQEAYVIFEGSRQKLCKLHTSFALNNIDDPETLTIIGPFKVINEGDEKDFELFLNTVVNRFHNESEDSTEVKESEGEKEGDEKENEVPRDTTHDHDGDMNRSDKDENNGSN